MRICFASLLRSKSREGPSSFLDRTIIYRALCRELARRGHTVDVVIPFSFDSCLKEDGVTYHFIQPGFIASRVSALFQSRTSRRYEPEMRCIAQIRQLEPEVIHFFGTVLHLNLWLLLQSIDYRQVPVLLH